jgi:hypothetical protein
VGPENCDFGESTELLGRCKDASFCKDGLLNLLDSTRVGLLSKQFIGAVAGRASSTEGSFKSLRKAEFDCRRDCLADDVVKGLPELWEVLGMVRGVPASSRLCIRSCSSLEKCWRRIFSGSDR